MRGKLLSARRGLRRGCRQLWLPARSAAPVWQPVLRSGHGVRSGPLRAGLPRPIGWHGAGLRNPLLHLGEPLRQRALRLPRRVCGRVWRIVLSAGRRVHRWGVLLPGRARPVRRPVLWRRADLRERDVRPEDRFSGNRRRERGQRRQLHRLVLGLLLWWGFAVRRAPLGLQHVSFGYSNRNHLHRRQPVQQVGRDRGGLENLSLPLTGLHRRRR